MKLRATRLTDAEQQLRHDVSTYLDQRLPSGSYPLGLGMAGARDKEFSKDLGDRGWLGMALPVEFGGHGRSAVDRLIVVEELLARGAPVGFHWVADRQCGPNIALTGTRAQKEEFLPRIAAGEISFAIGMSEPDSGSDLASLRTRAEPTAGGWLVNGSKIWTSTASEADYILALLRTSESRHGGLSQFIIDRRSPGVSISTVPFIDGTTDFCVVTFEDVFLADDRLLGAVGAGWAQNRHELVLERGGVDRWMTVMPILEHWVRYQGFGVSHRMAEDLGGILARCWGFHEMSLALAREVDRGGSPTTEAAVLKDMATRFEQECVEIVLQHLGRPPDPTAADPYEVLLAQAVLVAPSWTIRGGTSEIMRNIITKELMR